MRICRFFLVRSMVRDLLALALLLPVSARTSGQNSGDTLAARSTSPGRMALVGGGSALLITGAWIGLDQAWYADYERTSFHFFNDGGEWMGMDKCGHLFSAYTTAEWGTSMFRWAGASPSVSRWVGGSLGWVFLAGVEVMDGHSEGWGFSPWDLLANTTGSLLFIGQDAAWGEQRFRLKFSAHLTEYALQRPEALGEGTAERILKDYNGQTYWLSMDPRLFGARPRKGSWASVFNVAVGYGAEGMLYAKPGTPEGVEQPGRRPQFYLSLDACLHRISTRSRFVRTVLDVLDCVKVPAPALEFSDGAVTGHWLYF